MIEKIKRPDNEIFKQFRSNLIKYLKNKEKWYTIEEDVYFNKSNKPFLMVNSFVPNFNRSVKQDNDRIIYYIKKNDKSDYIISIGILNKFKFEINLKYKEKNIFIKNISILSDIKVFFLIKKLISFKEKKLYDFYISYMPKNFIRQQKLKKIKNNS